MSEKYNMKSAKKILIAIYLVNIGNILWYFIGPMNHMPKIWYIGLSIGIFLAQLVILEKLEHPPSDVNAHNSKMMRNDMGFFILLCVGLLAVFMIWSLIAFPVPIWGILSFDDMVSIGEMNGSIDTIDIDEMGEISEPDESAMMAEDYDDEMDGHAVIDGTDEMYESADTAFDISPFATSLDWLKLISALTFKAGLIWLCYRSAKGLYLTIKNRPVSHKWI